MIGQIRGVLVEKQPPEILVDVAGVGYEIQMPMSCFYQLPEEGEEVKVCTHFVVREDAQLLFGFNNKHERHLFRELIKTNGVGPKLGLAILSGMSASQFIQCVENEDTTTLVKLPGVGKKTAERLVVELKDRLKNWSSGDLFTPATDAAPIDSISSADIATDAKEEAISALVALGYKQAQAAKVVAQIATDDMSSETMIRDALRSMV